METNKESSLDVLLSRYQVRRSKKQKDAFIGYMAEVCQAEGFSFREEPLKGGMNTSRNLIVGDPETAKVVYIAHYDTCSEMPLPNLIYPQHKALTVLVQMPLIFLMLLLSFGVAWAVYRVGGRVPAFIAWYVVYFGLFALIFFGPANPHTANDNTSGVAALLEIMAALPEERKQSAAFIFFDNEELGKVGSKAYAKAHPGQMEGKILLNLDCVGDGDDFLIIAPKQEDPSLEQALRAAFQDENGKRAIHCSAKNISYNSDQLSFPNGAAVAAVRKGRLGYHVPRIHTRRDVVCEEASLRYVRDGALRLLNHQSNQEEHA